MKFLRIILIIILATTSKEVVGQVFGARDCYKAAILCTEETVYDTIVSPGSSEPWMGEVNDIPSGIGTSCFSKSERRPFWYQFTAENSGTFEMFIEDDGDWDFVLYDKSNGCGNGNWIEIACNASDDVGNNTGISSEMNDNWDSPWAMVSPWQPTVELIKDRTYAILINGADTGPGDSFALSFGGTVRFKNIEASFLPDQNPSCLGRAVNFTNTSTYPAGNTTFYWDFGDGNTANTEHASHTYDEPGSYWVKLVTDNGYCMDEDSMEIFITKLENVDAGEDQTICNGISTELNASGGISYSWSPAESLNDPNIQNPIASPSVTTEYVLTVVNEIGCIGTDTIAVNVTYIEIDAGEDQEICQGDTVQLSATGGVEYQWSPNDGTLSQVDISNPLATPLNTTTYTVTITDEEGCINSDEVTITIKELPEADAGQDTSICFGVNTQLNASGGIHYSWSPTESLNDANLSNPVATPHQTSTFAVTVTGENGCFSIDSVTVNVTFIEIDAGDDLEICNGTSAQLNASGGVEYTWNPTSTLSANNISNPVATPNETTGYIVTVTDEKGCVNYDSVIVNVDYIEVSAGEDQVICEGETALLQATGGDIYSWSPAFSLNDSEIANPEATPSETTEYVVTVTDNEGCVNTDTVVVKVNPLPVIEAGENVTICNGLSTQLNATGTASVWSWSPSEGLSATDINNPIASPSVTTTYTVIGYNEFNCSTSDEVTVTVTYIDVDAGEDQEICNGLSAQLNASGGEQYIWSPNATLSADNILNPVATPNQTTEYIVTVTDEIGCINADTVTVNVTYIEVNGGNDETICEGDTINLEATGGINYSWSPSAFMQNANTATPSAFPIETTDYIVTVEDEAGCINYDTLTINVNPKPAIYAGEDQEICYGTSARLTATGDGNFLWSPESTLSDNTIADPIATPTETTEYELLITDENGCKNTDSITVNVKFIEVDATGDQEICFGESTQLNATGGTIYSWTPDATLNNSEIADPIAAPEETITYTVTITDENGCINYDSLTILVNPIPSAYAGEDTIICYGVSSQLNATGGISYSWTPSSGLSATDISNPEASPSATTTYKVLVTDENNCSNSDEVTIDVSYIAVSAGEDITICNGLSAQLEASGGINYSWAPEASLSEDNISNPVATPNDTTQYIVTVTDEEGCINYDSVTVNVTYIDINVSEDAIICAGDSAQLEAFGGESYSWSPDESLNDAGIANPVVKPTETTKYYVTITDAEGCVNSDSVTVFVNPLPIADAGEDIITCNGVSVQLNASGGDIYFWEPAESLSDAEIANPIASPSETTTYIVSVTDENGCTSTDEVTVIIDQIEVSAGEDQVICFEDSAQLEATGGMEYSWSPAGSLSESNIFNPLASPAATTEYIVTVTDADGCINTDTVTVTVNPLPLVDAGEEQTICNGISAELNGSGEGTFSWSPEATLSATDIENPVATPSESTIYTLTVTDENGCTNTDETTVHITYIEVDAGNNQIICNGVSAQLNASGGVSYLWTPAESLSNSSVQNPIATPNQTTEYSVRVTDAEGCINTDTVVVNVTYITVDSGEDQTICFGNTAELNASGGLNYLWYPDEELSDNSVSNPIVAPSDTTDFIVKITDEDGCVNTDTVRVNVTYITVDAGEDQFICEGSEEPVQLSAAGGVSYTWFPREPLNYNNIQEPTATITETTQFTVIVTDENGCINSDTITIHITPPPTAYAGEDQTICNGLSVELNASGGESYLWSPTEGLSESDISNPVASPSVTTNYTVTVTDSNGCSNTDQVTVNITYIDVDAGGDQDICQGASTELSASGGESYTWFPSNSNQPTITVSPSDTTVYSVRVIDENGCVNTDSVQVNIKPLPQGYAVSNPEANCSGSEVTIGAFFDEDFSPSASMAYSFDGGVLFQNSNEFTIPEVNSDTLLNLVLYASNGCYSENIEHQITLRTLDATVSVQNPISCFGYEDGAVIIEISNGTEGYLFSVDGIDFQSENIISNLSARDYNIIVVDDGNCRFELPPVTLTEPEALTLEVKSISNVNPCAGDNNGEIIVEANGGTPAYTYSINGGSAGNEPRFSSLPAYNHIVSVTDENGCVDNKEALVIEPDPVNIEGITASITNNVCHGKREGEITLNTNSISGGVAPYTFSFAGTTKDTPTFSQLFAGNYNIIITDDSGCTFRFPFTIEQPAPITFYTSTIDESCENRNGVININNPQGGTPPYRYSLNGNNYVNNPEFVGLAAGTYQNISVMDVNGCSAGQPDTVRKKEGPDTYISLTNVSCYGFEDGITLIDSVIGGSPFTDDETGSSYFEFSLDNINWSRDSAFNGLAADTFQLFVRDQECIYIDEHPYLEYNRTTQEWDTLMRNYFILGQPEVLEAEVYSTPSIRNQSDGTIGIYSIFGGTSPYYFSGNGAEYQKLQGDTALLTGYDRGMHTVFLQDTNGCKLTLKTFVEKPMLIPNLITPNNDGLNDYFQIVSLPLNTKISIYNRWGAKVYEDENYNNSWDGEGVPDGVYYYDIIFPDNRFVKGWIEVIR